MKNQGLIFIPDISGFSQFVHETEIGHSRLIIQELLEILINANKLGLEISEIEGDAILFYKFGSPPELKELYGQVELMFIEFHRSLMGYDQHRYCQCKACISAIKLTLKVITHYGEFTDYHVKNFKKLIGKDIIVAHQLLKNDIPQHEYWLVTQSLLANEPLNFKGWMKWSTSSKQTETGEISFQYAQLSQLKNEIGPEYSSQLDIEKMSKMFSVQREYLTDIITLFHAPGDFQYRHRWQVGVKAVEMLTHFLPRVGMKCRCTLESGSTTIYSNDYYYSDNKIQFSEIDEGKTSCTRFILERTGIKKTTLTLDFYLIDKFITQVNFRLSKKNNLKKVFDKSLQNLESLVRELKIPTAVDA